MKRGLMSVEKLYGSVYNNEYVYVELECESKDLNISKTPLVELSKQSASYENGVAISGGTTWIETQRIIKDTLNISCVLGTTGSVIDKNYSVGLVKETTTLSSEISNNSISISGTDLSAFPQKFGLIKIDDEFIHYISRSGNTLTLPSNISSIRSYGRGYGYTMPTYHKAGATITNMSDTAEYKKIKLQNLVTRGGLCLVNIKNFAYGNYTLSQTAALDINGAIGSTDTSIVLSSVTGLSASGLVKIDDEIIYYTSISSLTLQNCIRGYGGSVAATHSNGSVVLGTITACPGERTAADSAPLSRIWGCMITSCFPKMNKKEHSGMSMEYDKYDIDLSFIYGREQ